MSSQTKEIKNQFSKGQLFRHRDGGFYKYEKTILFTEDQDELIVYTHVWPFESQTWARRATEFCDGRFAQITAQDLKEAKKTNRKEMQQIIRQAKALRKG